MHDLIPNVHRENAGLLARAKQGLFQSLYTLRENMVLGERFFFASTLVCTAQQLYLPFVGGSEFFFWPYSFGQGMQTGLRYISFGFVAFSTATTAVAVSIMVAVAILGSIWGMVVLSWESNRKSSRTVSIAPAMDVALRVCNTVLLQPMCVTLASALQCHQAFNGAFECNGAAHATLKGLSIVFLGLFLTQTSIYALIVIQPVPRADRLANVYCAPHGRVEFAATLIRATTAIGVVALQPQASATVSNVIAAVVTTSAALQVGLYYYFLPFHDMSWNRFIIGCNSIFLWASLCLVLAQTVANRGDLSSLLVFVVALPLFCFSMLSLVRQRIVCIRDTKSEVLLQSPYLAELRLRLLYSTAGEPDGFNGEAEKAYRSAVEAFPDSAFLNLYTAALTLAGSKKVVYALNLIRHARHLPLQLDLEFFLHCHNRANQERQNKSSGAISFMDFDRHLGTTRDKIMETLKLSSRFWRKVGSDCTVDDLILQGHKIHQAAAECRQNLQRLLKLSDSSFEAMRWYAIFTAYVMNDKHSANRILSRRDGGKPGAGSSGFAVCTVSGNMSNLGQIMDCTDACCHLFGYAKEELIGRNVKILCPGPFADAHDAMIAQFLASDADFCTKTRRIYGLHRNGHLLPVDFVITPSTNANSDLVLIGKFEERPLADMQHLLLLDGKSGVVLATSESAPEELRLDADEIFTMNVRILDLVPDFYKEDGTLRYMQEANVHIGDGKFRLRAQPLCFNSTKEAPQPFAIDTVIVLLTLVDRVFFSSEEEGSPGHRIWPPGAEVGPFGHDSTSLTAQVETSEAMPQPPRCAPPQLAPPALVAGGRKPPQVSPGRTNASLLSGHKHLERRSPSSPGSPTGPMIVNHKWRNNQPSSSGIGDGHSVASSSVDQGLSVEAQIIHIQRKIMGTLQRRDPQHERFSRFARRFVLVFTLVAALNAALVGHFYTSFLEETAFVLDVFEEAQLLPLVASAVFAISAPPAPGGAPRIQQDAFALLHDNLATLRARHEALAQVLALQPVSTELEMAMFEPALATTPGKDPVSFHVGVLEFAKHAEKFWRERDANCTESCELLLAMGVRQPLEAALKVSRILQNEATADLGLVDAVALGSIGLVAGLLLLSFIVGFAPMILSQDKHRKSVGGAFKAIPPDVCKQLQQRTHKRLVKLQQGLKIDLAEDEDAEDDLAAIDELESLHADEPGPRMSNEADDDEEEEKPGDRVSDEEEEEHGSNYNAYDDGARGALRRVWPSGRGRRKILPAKRSRKLQAAKRKTRTSRFQIDSRCQRALRILESAILVGFEFWLVLGFFAVFAMMDKNAHTSAAQMSAAMFASGQRSASFRSLVFWLQQPATAEMVGHLEQDIVSLKHSDYALVYGNSSVNVQAFTEASGELYELYFGDACKAECRKYLAAYPGPNSSDAKFLQYGLQLALEKLVVRAQDVHEAAAHHVGSGHGNRTLREVEAAQAHVVTLDPLLLLGQQLQSATGLYHDTLEQHISDIKHEKVVGACALLAALLLGHIVSMRAFARIDKNLKDTKTLLLMLPVEVFTTVPSMQKLLKDSQAQHGSA